jgi:hypothetical protein
MEGLRTLGRWQRWLAAAGLSLAFAVFGAPAAAVPAPQAPATSSGTYTVWNDPCACSADWIEESVDGGSWTYVGQGSVTFADKPSGVYYYRVGNWLVYADYYYWYEWAEYSSEISVTVGADGVTIDPLETQLEYRYETRYGDGNGDGLTDLLLNRIAGGSSGNGTIEAVMLLQAGGQYASFVPSSTEAAVAQTWPEAAIEVVLEDFNVDGFADILLKGVAGAIGEGLNQIVYAPGRAFRYQPLGVRAVDAGLKQFAANALDYFADSNYFANNAPVTYFYDAVYYYYCVPSAYYDFYDNEYCFWVPIYYSWAARDFSVFEPNALGTWTTEASILNNSLTRDDGVSAITRSYENVIGAPIGGRDFGGMSGEQGSFDDPTYRRGLEGFLAVLGIGNANAQELDPPRETTRHPEVVYVTGRRVLGFLPLHTALEYGGATLSAFDSDDSVFGNGVLVSRPNAPSDRPRLMMTLGTVGSTLGAPVYWQRLVAADAGYGDNLPYSPTPSSASDTYNSNGFTHGLIQATAGAPSVDMNGYVGGDKPVPASAFY